MTRFGDFEPLCSNVPSYPWCNLFYRQLLRLDPHLLTGLSNSTLSAPVGVNPQCGIPRVGYDGSIGNVPNIVLCGVSIIAVSWLIFLCNQRKAAVGRIEHRAFLIIYLLTLPFQLITTGSFLEQGSTPLVVLTAVHAGLVAALFWALLANAIISLQVVDDGSPSSLIPFFLFAIAFLCGTTYISLDVALGVTKTLGGPSNPIQSIRSIPLFILTSIWPAVAALLYVAIMTYVVLRVLQETRPMMFYLLAAALFVLSQLDYFLLSRVICKGANRKIDGSFVATILETAAVGVLYLGWRSITESAWEDDSYFN